MARKMGTGWFFAALLVAACVGPTDDASQVHDLRVLAIKFEPPEMMSRFCDNALLTAFYFSRPVKMTSLISDPKGEGRTVDYRISACANVNDHKCENENDFRELADGGTTPGTMEHQFSFATTLLPLEDGGFGEDGGSGVPLLQEVVAQDTYRGLGGARIPVVLEAQAGDEHVYAQKLMVYSCQFFQDQKENVNPEIPGILLDGQLWAEGQVRTLSGTAPFVMTPVDFADREEDYIVPSFGLEPIYLREAWKISWHATLGKFASTETGGVDFAGEAERHRNEWTPRPEDIVAPEQDVTFTFVARDGRGGLSWTQRTAHYVP